jgi:hypothetical protein
MQNQFRREPLLRSFSVNLHEQIAKTTNCANRRGARIERVHSCARSYLFGFSAVGDDSKPYLMFPKSMAEPADH